MTSANTQAVVTPADSRNGEAGRGLGAAPCYAPTMNLQWFEADQKEESGPCAANLRGYPECGTTGYVLRQWWTDGKSGEWRNVETGWNNEPPKAHNVRMSEGADK